MYKNAYVYKYTCIIHKLLLNYKLSIYLNNYIIKLFCIILIMILNNDYNGLKKTNKTKNKVNL